MKSELPPTVTTPTPLGGGGRSPKPCLKIVRGARPGRTFALPVGTLVIGRAPDCDVVLEDQGVSRRHAELVVAEDDTVLVRDLGSHNGTLVDDERVETAPLRDGSVLVIGSVTLRFGLAVLAEASDAGLSERELEVARLVAQGLSNAEVGKKLFISPKTVTAHLTHIYDRLGFRKRAALTRYLAEHGLLDEPGNG